MGNFISTVNSNLINRVGNIFVNGSITTNLKVLDTGIYSINNFDNGITDCPIGGYGMIIVSKVNNYYEVQMYISYSGGLFVRYNNNGNWEDWKHISYQ